MTQSIDIRGARTHNLKNISLNIPRDKLVVITGLSGSGKSSLAFDTLYAEGQRRYVESLSSYARQFLSMMDKPDVDYIGGLSPAIAIEQKATSHNPRSTVGTVTEIYDYLRLLYARVGEPRCPTHGITLAAQTVSQMVDQVLALPDETRVMLLAPIIKDKKGEYQQLWLELRAQGFVRAKVNGELVELDNPPKLALRQKHTIEVVVDRLKVKADAKQRLAESIETALKMANGIVKVECLGEAQEQSLLFSAKFACPDCGYSLTELEPRLFSFNSPAGACPACDGLGVMQFFDAERVVYNPKLSLAAGAIRGWDQRNAYYFAMLQGVAKHYQVDIQQPYKSLPKIFQDAVLHGTGDTEILQTFFDSRGKVTERRKAFPGILAIIERRYKDTDSSLVREELSKYISMRPCDSCSGARLRIEARHVYVNDLSISALTAKSITEILDICQHLSLSGYRAQVADKIQQELVSRLGFLANVGLNYLTLDRSAETLSGGEAQRIRLASQIGAGLVGVMYVLDEPSIGLHQRDNERLLKTLTHLRDLGNTVLVVEHDEEAILLADHVIDLGPGAGVHGGEIVAQGAPSVIKNNKNSLTGDYLSGRKQIAIPEKRRIADLSRALQLKGAKGHNLKNIDVTIPLGLMTCVTGVSGSGKSTLINDTLYPVAATLLNGAETLSAAPYDVLEGIELLDKVIDIDQSPIGRTPRSNPATYTGLFTDIRSLFAGTQEARSRGYQVGRFSFNVKGGRCEACQGDGVIKVEMHFLPDVYVACDVCQGKRYNRETLDVLYKGKSIHDVLELTIEDALLFFKPIPSLARRLQTLVDVGLGYIKLGQSATTLSGGEAQRVKLAKELSKRDTGNTLYILDEPTTGLHFHDIAQLLTVLNRLRDEGNTVVIIEHNLDVIKTADWIIDLGPEGGSGGGTLLVEGTPEHVATCKKSYTGQFLAPLLRQSRSLKKSAVA